MPTYEYRCAKGHTFERVQKMSDPAIDTCDVCGAEAVRAISGGAGLIFKGSGFYITDYRDKSYTDKAKAESGGGDAKSGGETKSDAKTETKSDTPAKTESKPAATEKPKTPSKSAKKK